MLKEIRKIPDWSRRIYLHNLTNTGKLNKYISALGYVCYDTEEYKEYKKNTRVGRPPKMAQKGEL